MPQPLGASTTRSAFLELKDERNLINEGYDLLDQKRIMLAAEILRQLDRYRDMHDRYQAGHRHALSTLAAACHRHGFDELTVYPPLPVRRFGLNRSWQELLGVPLAISTDVEMEPGKRDEDPVFPSLEAEGCATAFRELVTLAATLGSLSNNIRRLCREYVQTERRARALENVLLPELDATLRFIDEQLENADQEDVIRVRVAYPEER